MRLFISILFGLISNAYALQSYDVKNGSEITVSVYKSGLSRIYLDDDRISGVKGLAGEFQIEKNEEIGDMYIKPMSTRTRDEIDIFIQSEKGNTYSLRLKVDAEKPETIRLDAVDLTELNQTAAISETVESQAAVIELIKIAAQGHEIKGYNSQIFDVPNRLSLRKNVYVILQKTYTGREYRIEALKIENNTKKSVKIHERDLAAGMDVVAISVENRTLDANESSQAYRVVKL